MPNSRRRAGHNRPGIHLLSSARVVDSLVTSCAPGPSDLVVDLGAGLGAITAPLARTGARVVAVERDPDFARRLAERVSGNGRVRVQTTDIRAFPLPRKDFLVVASIPYALSTDVLRRLLNPWTTRLRRAALLVEWGFAKRLTTPVPRNRELAWWAARFDIDLVRRVPAHSFSPPPRVASAHLLIQRRKGLDRSADDVLWTMLGLAYRAPHRPARAVANAVTGGRPHRTLVRCGIDPAAPAALVRPDQWAALAGGVSWASKTRGR